MLNSKRRLLISCGIFILSVLGIIYTTIGHNLSLNKVLGTNTEGALKLEAPAKVVLSVPFEVTLSIDTQGRNVNAVGTYLHYDMAKLQLMQMDTRPSFCQFYPEKKFDNQLGTVSLACGAPHPGVNGTSTLMILEFVPTALGQTTILVDPKSQILVSDGKGTNILKKYQTVAVDVVNNL